MAFDADRLDARDPRLIAAVLPVLRVVNERYPRLQRDGLEHLPRAPALFCWSRVRCAPPAGAAVEDGRAIAWAALAHARFAIVPAGGPRTSGRKPQASSSTWSERISG